MQFPSSFFEDEVREGFYVSSIMKRAWAAQLEVLEEIDRVCKKYNIQYFAEWGTLLGAVRHNGYIPWDDDLDICMKRPDFDKFMQIAGKELSDGYSLISLRADEGFYDYLIRVINTRIINMQDGFLEKFHEFPYVAGVDIFPLDYVAPTEEDDKLQCSLIQIVGSVADTIDNEDDEQVIMGNMRQIEEMCNVQFDYSKPLRKQLQILAERLCALYGEEEAEELTLMPLWVEGGFCKFPKSYYQEAIRMPFENTSIPVPIEYDAILKQSYGNYMQPVHTWDSHEYPFYCKLESDLKQVCGIIPYEYEVPNYEVIQSQKATRCEKQESPYVQAKNIVEVMMEAHCGIATMFEQRDMETAGTLLENCQSAAISVGTMLEQMYMQNAANEMESRALQGKIVPIVSMLEEYCEAVYQLHEKIGVTMPDFDDCNVRLNELNDTLSGVANRISRMEEDRKSRKKIVFLTYKPEYWSAFADIWKAACEEPDNDVYVIPVPYYEKTFKRKFTDMHYDIDGYPEEVTLTAYDAYDFEKRMPDMIFIQNPFDEYNSATSVQPFFYASNIRKYTDCLVYVPCFVTDEIDPRDERAIKMMDHYVKMPGVVLADKVFVQSDAMRELYINVLTKAAGEESRQMWEQQVYGIGIPQLEQVSKQSKNIDIPEEWNVVLKGADKAILYHVSPSNFVHYGEEMIAKIKTVLAIFEENKDEVALLWYDEPMVSDLLEKKNPKVLEMYRQIVEEYKTAGWGIYDNSGDSARASSLVDAYYGDGGKVMNACRREKKPAMCQSVEIRD